MSYAVVWSEDGGRVYAGRLDLARPCVALAGSSPPAMESRRKLFYRELEDVRIERWPDLRLGGRPTLVLEYGGGRGLRVASLQGSGALHELADALACARGKAAERIRPAADVRAGPAHDPLTNEGR